MKSVAERQLSVVSSRLSVDKPAALPDSLAEALDSGLTFTTDGNDGGWVWDNGTACVRDGDCAKGFTCANGTDWMQTTVTGAGTLQFWCGKLGKLGGNWGQSPILGK